MPKFPGLSGSDIIKALQKLGFHVIRQSGSHIVLKRRNLKVLFKANNPELEIAYFNNNLKSSASACAPMP